MLNFIDTFRNYTVYQNLSKALLFNELDIQVCGCPQKLGQGFVIAVTDPSILINNMISIDDNENFTEKIKPSRFKNRLERIKKKIFLYLI